MPQQFNPQRFVCLDSLQLDTIWLDVDALPAKVFNPIDLPELVFFNVDSAIAHQVNWNKVDTFALHRLERRDTVFEKSFFNTYHTPGITGVPVNPTQQTTQLVMSASVLLILFAGLSILFSNSKNKLTRYFLSIFDKRKFKEYFAEENPVFFPTTPIVYLLQSMVVGIVLSTWLISQMEVTSSSQFIGITLAVMGCCALVPLIRNGFIIVLGNIFMIQQEARKHILISYLSHSLLFMLLLPLAIQLAIQVPEFSPYFNTSIYVCLAVTMGYQLIKLIQNTPLPDIGALLYIFLYFCTLEILPLILMYKMVSIYI